MSRRPAEWLTDVLEAVEAIRAVEAVRAEVLDTVEPELADRLDGVVIDALTYRVMTIGEAVKNLSPELLAERPEIPWSRIARMRDVITHHYHRRSLTVIRATVDDHLGPLHVAATALLADLARATGPSSGSAR